MKRIKGILDRLIDVGTAENKGCILKLLEENSSAKLLDLGCGDGSFTLELGKRIGTSNLYGVEIVERVARQSEQNGVKVYLVDLNDPLPIDSETFDVIVANQVIEHLHYTDASIKEIRRMLKRGGYAIISTPNLAAWHNIACLVLGLQPFGAHVSDEIYAGNPFNPRQEKAKEFALRGECRAHKRLFTQNALRELFQYHGFKVEKSLATIYYPFAAGRIARFLSRLDPRHAVFLAIKVRKV